MLKNDPNLHSPLQVETEARPTGTIYDMDSAASELVIK